jgi:hypothetical protein
MARLDHREAPTPEVVPVTATCVVCTQPEPDAYACVRCGITKPTEQLTAIVDMVPAARDVAHRLSAATGGSGGSGKPGSTLPLDLGATERLNAVQGELTTWVRHITAERGGTPRTVGSDPIIHSAWYLQSNLEWMRHRAEVDEFLRDVAACARVVARLARGPADRKYLGPCGAFPFDDNNDQDDQPCEGDVYVRGEGSVGRCRECGAEVARADREAWLDAEVRQYAYTAGEIAAAYPIKRNTINQWASRGRLAAHDTDGNGRPRYNLGDVLDLAAADAARRAENESKRARREVAA